MAANVSSSIVVVGVVCSSLARLVRVINFNQLTSKQSVISGEKFARMQNVRTLRVSGAQLVGRSVGRTLVSKWVALVVCVCCVRSTELALQLARIFTHQHKHKHTQPTWVQFDPVHTHTHIKFFSSSTRIPLGRRARFNLMLERKRERKREREKGRLLKRTCYWRIELAHTHTHAHRESD